MFTTRFETDNGIDVIILEHASSQTTVAIIPSKAGMLHKFELQHNGGALNLIESYPDVRALDDQLESTGFKAAKLSPFVCRLYHGEYHFGGKEYKVEKFYLLKHALHGIIYDAPFKVLSHEGGPDSARVELFYDYTGTDKGYPFLYRCEIVYELKPGNSLSVSTTIINNDKGLIPIADGWHPYFCFGGSINDLQLEFQSVRKVEFDDELIPTGKLTPYTEFNSLKQLGDVFLDNCFELNFATCQPMAVLRDPVKKIQVEIYPDISYPYLQIYTPPSRSSVAIENISSAPDAYNNGIGLVILEPGQQKLFTTTYKVKSLT